MATAVQAPPQPTLTVATDMPDVDDFEVLVYDLEDGERLAAAIELVSPANKDRPGEPTCRSPPSATGCCCIG